MPDKVTEQSGVASAGGSSEVRLRHPAGIYTLFFTEMWERFSYYGMRALLVLFMTDAISKGGLGFTDSTATAIYGLYTAFVYMVSLPGGWIADRLLGPQRAVWYGGILIAIGHFTLAIPRLETFFLGLMIIVIGTGLLKPNMSAMVGLLYPEGGARRDAGFTIFYMGINIGAALGPLVCSSLGEGYDWHWGFGAAGIGMTLGLVQFRLTAKHLGEAGRFPPGATTHDPAKSLRAAQLVGGVIVLAVLATVLGSKGVIRINPVPLAEYTTYAIVGLAAVYFAGIFALGRLDAIEVKRMIVLVVLLSASAMFWAGFEQAGSSLTLFAERFTDRVVNWAPLRNLMPERLHGEIPTGWFQSLNPTYIVIFAPMIAATWVGLARRGTLISVTAKFAAGLLLLALGFVVLIGGIGVARTGAPAAPTWLIATYLFHTLGEICLSPVGLSAVTKLAPARFVGQLMGLWFVATSLGNLIAGRIAGEALQGTDRASTLLQMSTVLQHFVMAAVGTGVLLLIFVRPIKKLMGDVK